MPFFSCLGALSLEPSLLLRFGIKERWFLPSGNKTVKLLYQKWYLVIFKREALSFVAVGF